MIDVEWYRPDGPGLAPDVEAELREMLVEAAEADVEAGFPRLSVDDPVEPGTSYLLIWLLPDERSGRTVPLVPSLAGFLRVEPLRDEDAGTGEVSYVVRPAYRSRGITTLLIEKIGLELGTPDGWQGTGVSRLRVWARANHPAALRMALRFRRYGIRTALREWQMLAPVRIGREVDPGAESRGPDVHEVTAGAGRAAAAELWTASGRRHAPPDRWVLLVGGPDERPDGAVWIDPDSAEPTEYGTAGRLVAVVTRDGRADRESDPLVRALLVAGLEHLRDAGLRVGAATIDSEDRSLVHEARTLGFMHDQTDVQYTVENRTAEPRPAAR
ncbi:GNAT family N-acetyltransferase [Pseudonocardia sp. ICBG162]|uniref:GNAT family N-acetyltransferase n=1 Tax=Pseudonocardia sp. ICBG162 TaxID=2846761 RepID=UPI001CF69801|nr:GNAT family N-acetyltransferase [Pseudonocardia sp. ICBG162]